MLKQLKKSLLSEKKKKLIWDIICYGSSVKGKTNPRDVDVLVIFREGTLKERLDCLQRIKSRLQTVDLVIDIQQILLTDLFSPHFFAKTGVLVEGISLFKNKPFAELLGFKAYTLFWYSLENLPHHKKVQFNYILAGRGTNKGLLHEFQSERLVNGAVKVPLTYTIPFENLLKLHHITYKYKYILEAQ